MTVFLKNYFQLFRCGRQHSGERNLFCENLDQRWKSKQEVGDTVIKNHQLFKGL